MMLWVLFFATFATISFAEEEEDIFCSFDVEDNFQNYKPPAYEASVAIEKASSFTEAEFANIVSMDFGNILNDPYVQEIMQATIIVTAVIVVLLTSFCYFACCRSKCCPCIKCPLENKWLVRIIMACIYGSVMAVSLATFSGSSQVGDSVETFEEGVDMVAGTINSWATSLTQQVDYIENMLAATVELKTGVCDIAYPEDESEKAYFKDQIDAANQLIQESGASLEEELASLSMDTDTVEKAVADADAAVNDGLTGVVDALNNAWAAYGSPVTLGFSLIFLVLGGLGILGALYPKIWCPHLGLSWCILALLSVVLALLLIFGIIMGDLCMPSPLTNIAEVMNSMAGDAGAADMIGGDAMTNVTGNVIIGNSSNATNMTEEEGDFVTYYVQCEGANPMANGVNTMVDAVSLTLQAGCVALTAVKNESYSYSYDTGNSAIGDNGVLTVTVNKVNPQQCKEVIEKIQFNLDALNDNLRSIIDGLLSCKFVNEPLALLLEQGLCNEFAGGLFNMWFSLFLSSCVLLLSMFITLPMWDVLEPNKKKKGKKQGRVVPVSENDYNNTNNHAPPPPSNNNYGSNDGFGAHTAVPVAEPEPEPERPKAMDPFNPNMTNPLDKAPLPAIRAPAKDLERLDEENSEENSEG
jgi:hypothetical protein